jgi:hypothetical protein
VPGQIGPGQLGKLGASAKPKGPDQKTGRFLLGHTNATAPQAGVDPIRRLQFSMSTKVEPIGAFGRREARIASAKEKWANPSLAKRVVQRISNIPRGGEHQKTGIDLLVEDHDHHHDVPKFMIHPNNPFRRCVLLVISVCLSFSLFSLQ